jgi:hypothetical protein
VALSRTVSSAVLPSIRRARTTRTLRHRASLAGQLARIKRTPSAQMRRHSAALTISEQRCAGIAWRVRAGA